MKPTGFAGARRCEKGGEELEEVYTAPRLEDLGSITELTLGGNSGNRLDADFSAGATRGELTFS